MPLNNIMKEGIVDILIVIYDYQNDCLIDAILDLIWDSLINTWHCINIGF